MCSVSAVLLSAVSPLATVCALRGVTTQHVRTPVIVLVVWQADGERLIISVPPKIAHAPA